MFRRRILPPVLVLLSLLLDVAVLPVFTQSAYMPYLTLLCVHCIGLLLGRTRGLWYALLAGLLMDILVSTPLGLCTVLFALAGYLGGVFGRAFTRHPLTPLIASAVVMTLYEAATYLYASFASLTFSPDGLLPALIRVGIEIAGVQAMYYVYDWILKPSRSRFAQR